MQVSAVGIVSPFAFKIGNAAIGNRHPHIIQIEDGPCIRHTCGFSQTLQKETVEQGAVLAAEDIMEKVDGVAHGEPVARKRVLSQTTRTRCSCRPKDCRKGTMLSQFAKYDFGSAARRAGWLLTVTSASSGVRPLTGLSGRHPGVPRRRLSTAP